MDFGNHHQKYYTINLTFFQCLYYIVVYFPSAFDAFDAFEFDILAFKLRNPSKNRIQILGVTYLTVSKSIPRYFGSHWWYWISEASHTFWLNVLCSIFRVFISWNCISPLQFFLCSGRADFCHSYFSTLCLCGLLRDKWIILICQEMYLRNHVMEFLFHSW